MLRTPNAPLDPQSLTFYVTARGNGNQAYFGCWPKRVIAYSDLCTDTENKGHTLLQCRVPADLPSGANFKACNHVLSCG